MGRPRRPPLLPIFRSEALARVLATILLSPEALNLRKIAARRGLSYSVVQREVDRLEGAEIVKSQRVAQSRVVSANETHPLYPELRALVLKTYGPGAILGDVLSRVQDVDEAFLFGSWAARYAGVWGPPPADVDVVIIGDPDPREIEEAAAKAEDQLGLPVEPVVVAPDAWKARRSGFVRTLRDRPLVPIEVGQG